MLRKVCEYFSRKFVLSLASLVGSFVLTWYDKDIMGWVAAISAILAFYQGANVFQTYVESKSNHNHVNNNNGGARPPSHD
jgi:hypothetical protein